MKEVKGLFNSYIGNGISLKRCKLSDKKSSENIPNKGYSKYKGPE